MCMCCYKKVLARKEFSNNFTPLPANPWFQQQPGTSGGRQPTSQQKKLYGNRARFLMFNDIKSIGSGCWLPQSILGDLSENRRKRESFHQPWKSHQRQGSGYKQPCIPINILITLSSLISHVSVGGYSFVTSKVNILVSVRPFLCTDTETSMWL